jgi:chromate transport protein ChrA
MGKLGTIAFGGPAVDVVMLRDETVWRRRWLAASCTESDQW